MLKRAGFLILSILMLILYHPPPAGAAEVILHDSFDNTDYVDLNKTSAYVNTAQGYVSLPVQAMPSALAMKEFGYEYAVATAEGINVYSYDDATGKMTKNPALSVPAVTSAIGVAVRQDAPDIWALTSTSLTLYKFNGSRMATSPNLQVTGLTDVIAVSAWSDADKAAVLTRSGTVTIYDASGGSLVPAITFSTGLSDPVAISVVPGTPDIVVAAGDAFYYYVYDDATGNYVRDGLRDTTGLNGVVSAGSSPGAVGILDNQGVSCFLQDDTGGYRSVVALSASPISGPVALSLKPGAYDYAVLTREGEVKYYTYDDGTGSVTENPALEVTGLTLSSSGYLHPKDYYSKVVTTGEVYNTIRLTVDQDLPPGTSVTWYVSSDGGITWSEVTPGSWVAVNPGNRFAVHAVLDTTDVTVTPKIFEVTLEVSKLKITDLKITAITYPPGAPEQPVVDPPITTFPVTVYAGSRVQFQVTTTGLATQVVAQFSDGQLVILMPRDPSLPETNTWVGEYQVSPEAPDGTTIAVTFTASDSGGRQAYLVQNPFLIVQGNVASFSKVMLTQ